MICNECECAPTVVGKVSVTECNRMYLLFRHLNALKDLGLIIPRDDESLYSKYTKDLEDTESSFQNWWDTMAEKYQWPSKEGRSWEINFETCEILLSES